METFWVNKSCDRNSFKQDLREGPLGIAGPSLGFIPEEHSGELELDLAETGLLLPFTPEAATCRTGSSTLDTETEVFLDEQRHASLSYIDC
jgi:hypothetical protein